MQCAICGSDEHPSRDHDAVRLEAELAEAKKMPECVRALLDWMRERYFNYGSKAYIAAVERHYGEHT